MKVSALQLRNYIGDQKAAFAAAEKLIGAATAEGSSLVALPELSSCGYIPNETIWQYAEAADGPTARWACGMAEKYAVYIGAGYLETDGQDFYNAYLIAAPDGRVAGRVHKMRAESYCFKPSDLGSVIETRLGKIAVGICADNHEVGFYDRLANLDFDLLLMPHAWATPFAANRYIHEQDIADAQKNVSALGAVYAAGFGVPVVFINSVGAVPPMRGMLGKLTPPELFRLRGGSAVFQPDGTAVRQYAEDEESVTADISLGRKNTAPLRPTVYNGWLHPGSFLIRKAVIPLDIAIGRAYYRRHCRARP